MAITIFAQGPRLEDSGAILRSLEGDKKSRLFMHKKAELVHEKATIWLHWRCITEKFLRLILRRKLWGLTGHHLKTIVDRTDARSKQLRRVWSDLGQDLKGSRPAASVETSIEQSLLPTYIWTCQIIARLTLHWEGDGDTRV